MIDLGPHSVFIIGAYAFAIIVIAGLVGRIMLDTKTQKRRLAELEARGIGRRSKRTA
ncbi:heme exporter protein CcmD [Microvirga sp. W0021]|uniref:Heme exporter protein D n=1 Tax=Hohaiivirga grylli TaxID=3133970 RepID=A0ABV0BEX5_9HYPH